MRIFNHFNLSLLTALSVFWCRKVQKHTKTLIYDNNEYTLLNNLSRRCIYIALILNIDNIPSIIITALEITFDTFGPSDSAGFSTTDEAIDWACGELRYFSDWFLSYLCLVWSCISVHALWPVRKHWCIDGKEVYFYVGHYLQFNQKDPTMMKLFNNCQLTSQLIFQDELDDY